MRIVSLFKAGRWWRGVLVLILAIGLAPAVPVALAQDLLPELAAPADQHKAADEALDKQKLEAIALAAKSYVSALDSIEKSATAKGEIDLVAAVVKEREAVASGALEPDLASALPKTRLQMSRKTLLASVERINTDFAKRKKKADADYLRALATLQPKAATNPELAKQLAAEKAALLGGGVAAEGNNEPTAKISQGKNVIINGDFEKISEGSLEEWKNTQYCTTENEDKNTYVRFDGKSVNNDNTATIKNIYQRITFPLEAKNMTVSARFRTKDRSWAQNPVAQVEFFNEEGKQLSCVQACYDVKSRSSSWKTILKKGSVPKNAVKATVTLHNARCPGQIDFDDVEVTFK